MVANFIIANHGAHGKVHAVCIIPTAKLCLLITLKS